MACPCAPWRPSTVSPRRRFPVTPSISAATSRLRHQAQQAKLVADLDELELLKTRLDRLFLKSEESQSLHISLGCLQESLRLLALRTKIRHTLEGRF